ncbi:hypothetical protein CDEST_07984 [Colletotrichum destructivum]|uniref:Uncharacterized protein n=1 Tax=Colletotrichum destructivum TaxID=34406 RepID=A0AAX4II13_9PEZI|nr:hypothetical protein CDEST_07984 [Colletotrichum destructivum]
MVRLGEEGETQGRSEEMEKLGAALVEQSHREAVASNVGGRQTRQGVLDPWRPLVRECLYRPGDGQSIMFDACSLYGTQRVIGKPYVRAYHKKYPKPEPVEDWDDKKRPLLHVSSPSSGLATKTARFVDPGRKACSTYTTPFDMPGLFDGGRYGPVISSVRMAHLHRKL